MMNLDELQYCIYIFVTSEGFPPNGWVKILFRILFQGNLDEIEVGEIFAHG